MKNIWKSAVIIATSPVANHHVHQDAAGKKWTFTDDGSTVDLFPPVHYGQVNGAVDIVALPSVIEVPQQVLILDNNFNGIPQLVNASTTYRMKFYWATEKQDTGLKGPTPYAYNSPAVLSTPTNDRLNMYSDFVAKINMATNNNHVTAQLVDIFSFTAGNGTVPVVGDTVTGATSTATATVVGVVQLTAPGFGGTTTGFMYVSNRSALPFTAAGEVVANGIAYSMNLTAATYVAGQGMIIIDNPGYFPARPNPRQGATGIALENLSFTMIKPNVVVVPVYGRGIGTRMIQDIPTYDLGNSNVVSGDSELFNVDKSPIAGDTYTKFIITVHTTPSPDSLVNMGAANSFTYNLWAQELVPQTIPAQLALDLSSII